MELRSYNVERIYKNTVKCLLGDVLGIDKKEFAKAKPDVKSMLSQIQTYDGKVHLCAANKRTDGEVWTPWLQIVEMLIRMGERAGYVKYEGRLKSETLLTINLED